MPRAQGLQANVVWCIRNTARLEGTSMPCIKTWRPPVRSSVSYWTPNAHVISGCFGGCQACTLLCAPDSGPQAFVRETAGNWPAPSGSVLVGSV